MNLDRFGRLGLPATALAVLAMSGSSAIAGGHHKRVLVGYFYPAAASAPAASAPAAYGVAGAPVAYAPTAYSAYAAAPAAGYAPVPYGTYAAAPQAGYAAAPTTGYAAAPTTGYAAAPTTGYAAAPTAAPMYLVGYYYAYQAGTAGAAGAPPAQAGAPPAAPAPGAAGSIPQPLPGARLVDPASRQAIVDQLVRLNASLTKAQVTDDLRMFQLNADAISLYASKLGVSAEALTEVDRTDAKNLLSAALGNPLSPAPNGGGSTGGGSTPTTGVMPVMPVMPVYAKPVHPWFSSHPKMYNLLSK